MNSVKIYVAKSQNNTNNTLIDGTALDLFETEAIPYTLKQTDLTDLGANYANFTKDFTIPASKNNNKTLKYWLDLRNDDQFQSSKNIPARIDIGGVFFQLGSIKILSFSTNESGEPKNYTITFTGALTSLKTKFGDDLIQDLPFASILGNDQFSMTDDAVLNSIVDWSTPNKPIEFPLITYNRAIVDFNQIKYEFSENPNGLTVKNLRPAMKFRTIFEAIEDKYDIDFIGDFIDDQMLDNIYLWMNKQENLFKEGGVLINLTNSPFTPDGYLEYHLATLIKDRYVTVTYASTILTRQILTYYSLVVSSDTVEYRGKIQEVILKTDGSGDVDEVATEAQKNFGIVAISDYRLERGLGLVKFTINYPTPIAVGTKRHFRVIGEVKDNTELDITRNGFNLSSKYMSGGVETEHNSNLTTSYITTHLVNPVSIKENLPEIKVQDFITNILKMLNLVIIPKNVYQYEIDWYNNYYGNGKIIDITKYCSPNKKINRVKTYKEIVFKPEKSEYHQNIEFTKKQATVREFGEQSVKFTEGDIDKFSVESKFHLIMFRELEIENYSEYYDLKAAFIIGDGYGKLDDSGNPSIVKNKPTIFFYNGKAELEEYKHIAFNRFSGTSSGLTTYTQFSNMFNLYEDYFTTLCYSEEYMFGVKRTKNLYSNYYQKLIDTTYSPYARTFDIDAILPRHIFTTISLNNQIVIGNDIFSISEINVDLLTGKSKLKLNNIIIRN